MSISLSHCITPKPNFTIFFMNQTHMDATESIKGSIFNEHIDHSLTLMY